MNYRKRAMQIFPGGSNGEYGIPPELVPVLSRGEGSRVWDTEGREYLDMTMCKTVGQILGDGPLAQVAFRDKPVTDHRAWRASDRARGRAVMLTLPKRGVFLNPMGTKLYLSLAHDEKALETFVRHFAAALDETR